jgi:hypothetical protein
MSSSSEDDEDDNENDEVVAVSSPRPLAVPPLRRSSSNHGVTTTHEINSVSGDSSSKDPLPTDSSNKNKSVTAAAAPPLQPVHVRVHVVPTPCTPAEAVAAAAANLGPTWEPTSNHNAVTLDREVTKNHSATEALVSNKNASKTRLSIQNPHTPVPLQTMESPLDATKGIEGTFRTPGSQVTNTPTTMGFSHSSTMDRSSPSSLERQFEAAIRQSCQLHRPIDSIRAPRPPLSPQRRRVRQACRNEQKRDPTKRKVVSNVPEQGPSKKSRISETPTPSESCCATVHESVPTTNILMARPQKPAHEVPSRRLGAAAQTRSVLETATQPMLAKTVPSSSARATAATTATPTTRTTTAMTKSSPNTESKDPHGIPAPNLKRTKVAISSSDPVFLTTIAPPIADATIAPTTAGTTIAPAVTGTNDAALQKANDNASRVTGDKTAVPENSFPSSDRSTQHGALAKSADTALSPKLPKPYENILLDTWDGGVQANLDPLLLAVTVDNVNLATSKAGWTALMVVCGLPKTVPSSVSPATVIDTLITELHANVRATDVDGWNCFHWAMFHGHRAALPQLVKSINDETIVKECCKLPDREGKTPLDIARQEGFGDLISLLPKVVTSSTTQPDVSTCENQDLDNRCESDGDDYDDSDRTLGTNTLSHSKEISKTSPTTILDSRSLGLAELEQTDGSPLLPPRTMDDPPLPLLPTNELASKCWKCWVVLKPMDPAKDDGPCLFTTHLHVVLDVRVCSVCAEEVAAIEQSTDCDEKHSVCAGCAMGEEDVDSTFFLCDTEHCERVFCRQCVAQAEASGADGWERTKAIEESDELWYCPVCSPPNHLIELRKIVQEDLAKESQAEMRSAVFLLDLLARAEAEKEQCEIGTAEEDENHAEYLLELRLADFISNLLDELDVKHSLSAAMCYMHIGMLLPRVARLDDPDPDQPWFRDADQEVRRSIQERRTNAQEISTYPAEVYEAEDYNDVEELGPEDTTTSSWTEVDRQGYSLGVRPTETALQLALQMEENLNIEVRQAPSDSADNDEILVEKEQASDGVARREFKRRRLSWIGVPKPVASRVSPSLDPRDRAKSPSTASRFESALPAETEPPVEGVVSRLPTSTNNGPSTNNGQSTDIGKASDTSTLGVSPARVVRPNSPLRLCVKGEMSDHNVPNVRSISVTPTLAKILMAHQSEGVHFMFRNCFSDFAWSLEGDAKRVGGCVLAHSMGLVSERI